MPGPKPKPTRLKMIQGTFRAHRALPNEPQPEGQIGEAPAYFNEAQKAMWGEVVGEAPDGLLAKVDRHCLEGYVVLLAARVKAIEGWNATANAILMKNPVHANRPYGNPYLKKIQALTRDLRILEGEFGFTPAARTRISLAPGGEGGDPVARFIGGAA